MASFVKIDRAGVDRLEWFTDARGRTYYRTIAPELGIVVVRTGEYLPNVIGAVFDARLEEERGLEGWCVPGQEGRLHGKAMLFREVDPKQIPASVPVIPLSELLADWKDKYRFE